MSVQGDTWDGGVEHRWGRYIQISAFLLTLFTAIVSSAQQEVSREYRLFPTPSGVEVPVVRDLLEDSTGAIWVATWGGGVHRIFQTEWDNYTTKNGLVSDWVRGLTLSPDGSVWVATADGLCRFTDTGITSYTLANTPDFRSENFTAILWTRDDALWLGNREGTLLQFFPDENGNLGAGEVLSLPFPNEKARIHRFYEDESGRVWASASNILLSWQDGVWTSAHTASEGDALYLGHSKSLGGLVGVGTKINQEAFQFDGNALQPIASPHTPVLEFGVTPQGKLLAGTYVGLMMFDGNAWQNVNLGKDVGKPAVVRILIASNNTIWLGTEEGLIQGILPSWQQYEPDEGESRLATLARGNPNESRLKLAIDEAQRVHRWRDGQWQLETPLSAHPLSFDYYHFGDSETLWCLLLQQVLAFSLVDGTQTGSYPLAPLGPSGKKALYRDARGDLIATSEQGIYRLRDGAWQVVIPTPDYERRSVQSVFPLGIDEYYVGLEDGLEYWSKTSTVHYGEAQGVNESDSVHAVLPQGDDTVWFGSFGSGLYRLRDQTISQLTPENSALRAHSISFLMTHSDGSLWFAYRHTGAGSLRGDRILNFSHRNGLPNTAITAIQEGDDGHTWISTRTHGLYHYVPDSIAPETYLTASPETLPPSGAGIFSFYGWDAWAHTNRSDLFYSWRIAPADSSVDDVDWSPFAQGETVAVADLAPGRYRFEVRAADGDRNFDATPAVATFEVLLPLYRKASFVAPLLIAAIVAGFAVFLRVLAHRELLRSRATLQRTNEQMAEEIRQRAVVESDLARHRDHLEELVAQRTRDLERTQEKLLQKERLAALGQATATVGHELRNPLGTVCSSVFSLRQRLKEADPAIRQTLDRAERNIKRCNLVIDEVLDYTRNRALETERGDIDSWLRMTIAELPRPEDVAIAFDLQAQVAVDFSREGLRRALVNVLDNAVQAMEDVEGSEKQITVSTYVEKDQIYIVCTDNGPGMDDEGLRRILEPFFSTRGSGVGLGGPIVQNILQRHGGDVRYDSKPGQGTTVTLYFPTTQAAS